MLFTKIFLTGYTRLRDEYRKHTGKIIMSKFNQKDKSLSRNSFLILLSSFLRQGISLFSGVVAARLLLPQDFGIIGMAATFSGLIDVFSRFGLKFLLSVDRKSPMKKLIPFTCQTF